MGPSTDSTSVAFGKPDAFASIVACDSTIRGDRPQLPAWSVALGWASSVLYAVALGAALLVPRVGYLWMLLLALTSA